MRLDTPLRRARTCYRHLAGVAGVALLDELLARGWLRQTADGTRPVYELTAEGASGLRTCGVLVDGGRGSGAIGCLDWTERRMHLGGALGAVIARAMEADGTLRRGPGTRAVTLAATTAAWLDGGPAPID